MKHSNANPVSIMICDDDDDDFMLTTRELKRLQLRNPIARTKNGRELIDYLRGEGTFVDTDNPRPSLILLDINMPIMNGIEALRELKSDPALKDIVVVVLTTSQAEEDRIRSYALGVNSFVRKPVDHHEFVQVVTVLKRYWLEIVELPCGQNVRS